MFELTGKTALVTGASGDIGRAIAQTLHRQGASVALSGTKVDRLEALAGELGDRVCIAPGDLSTTEGAKAAAEAAEAGLGQIDILINNAGLTRDNLAMRLRDEDFEQVLEVNLVSAFRLARAVMKGMLKRRWGRIISVTSVVAFVGTAGEAALVEPEAGVSRIVRILDDDHRHVSTFVASR